MSLTKKTDKTVLNLKGSTHLAPLTSFQKYVQFDDTSDMFFRTNPDMFSFCIITDKDIERFGVISDRSMSSNMTSFRVNWKFDQN